MPRRSSMLAPRLFDLPAPKTEREIQRECVEWLEIACGLRVFRSDVPTGRKKGLRNRATGLTDLHGVLPGGRAWFVELKKPGARQRQDQAKQNETIAYLRGRCALVAVVSSLIELQSIPEFHALAIAGRATG